MLYIEWKFSLFILFLLTGITQFLIWTLAWIIDLKIATVVLIDFIDFEAIESAVVIDSRVVFGTAIRAVSVDNRVLLWTSQYLFPQIIERKFRLVIILNFGFCNQKRTRIVDLLLLLRILLDYNLLFIVSLRLNWGLGCLILSLQEKVGLLHWLLYVRQHKLLIALPAIIDIICTST